MIHCRVPGNYVICDLIKNIASQDSAALIVEPAASTDNHYSETTYTNHKSKDGLIQASRFSYKVSTAAEKHLSEMSSPQIKNVLTLSILSRKCRSMLYLVRIEVHISH